jgi:hypothetical protein
VSVVEVARPVAETAQPGVRAEQRTGEQLEQFPKAGCGQVGDVDGPATAGQLRHQHAAGRAQSAGDSYGVAVGKAVGAGVGEADDPQTPGRQLFEI